MLQLPVLVLQMLQFLGFSAVHPTVLRFPTVIGLLRDAVLPTQLRCGQPSLSLLQDRDHLFFTMPCPLHLRFSLPGFWRNSHSTWHTFRGLGHYHKTRERICELCSKLGGSNGFVYDSNESRLFQVTCACPDIMRSSEGLIHE